MDMMKRKSRPQTHKWQLKL